MQEQVYAEDIVKRAVVVPKEENKQTVEPVAPVEEQSTVLTAEDVLEKGVVIPKPTDKSILQRESKASAISNFFNNSIKDVGERIDKTDKMLKSGGATHQVGLAVGGQLVAGSVLDVAGNAFSLGFEGVKVLVPDMLEEQIANDFTASFEYIKNTEIGKEAIEAVGKGYQAYDKFAKQNPQVALSLESVFNIAAFFNPNKAKSDFKLSPDAVGDSLSGNAKKYADFAAQLEGNNNKVQILENVAKGLDVQADNTIEKVALDLALPEATPKVAEKRVWDTDVSGTGTNSYQPTPYELEVAGELAKSGIVRTKNLQRNFNIIKDKIGKEADSLIKDLAQYDSVEVPREYVKETLIRKTNDKMKDSIFIKGQADTEAMVDTLHTKLTAILDANSSNPSGLIKARKELDRLVKEELGSAAYDTDMKKSMLMEVVKSYRNNLNDLVAESAPNVQVLESLKKQSLKYSALDNIAPRAAKQNETTLGRAWQNVQGVAGVKRDTNMLIAGGFGVGAMTAAAAMMPYVAGGLVVSGAGTLVYRGVTNPTMKRSLALLLRNTDKALKKATDPNQILTLKADRVALIELMKLPVEKEEEPPVQE